MRIVAVFERAALDQMICPLPRMGSEVIGPNQRRHSNPRANLIVQRDDLRFEVPAWSGGQQREYAPPH